MQPDHHAHHRIGHTLFAFGAFLLLIVGTILLPITSVDTQAFGVSDIVKGSNDARTQLNKNPLTSSVLLMSAAQMKAEDMAKGHFFAHTAPDGTVAWDYFKKVGYTYDVAGENLAITNEGSDAVINGWLNSPTHRENLLSTEYSDMGIGIAPFGDYQGHKNTFVVVAFYGRRGNTAQAVAAPTNPAGGTTSLKPRFIGMSPAALATVGVGLMAVGIGFEIRHIRRLHNSKHLA
jgi:hypothetical protein